MAADRVHMFPAVIIPLWDPVLAAAEIERGAAKGARSLCFSEHPPSLGLPSIHDRGGYWDLQLAASTYAGSPAEAAARHRTRPPLRRRRSRLGARRGHSWRTTPANQPAGMPVRAATTSDPSLGVRRTWVHDAPVIGDQTRTLQAGAARYPFVSRRRGYPCRCS